MDSQPTGIGTRNINPCVKKKKKLLILASFEESLIWFYIVISVYQVEEHNLRIFSSEVLQLQFMS